MDCMAGQIEMVWGWITAYLKVEEITLGVGRKLDCIEERRKRMRACWGVHILCTLSQR